MVKGIVVAVAAALTFSLTTATAQASEPKPRPESRSTVDPGARWHATGRWKGLRDNTLSFYMRTSLRIKRNDAGRLRGTAVYRDTDSKTVLCRTRLRFVKRTKSGWIVFHERWWFAPEPNYCNNGRTRMHRWPKNRLRVYWLGGSIRDEGMLHRP
ncbi:MAG: hypothetical protein ACRDO7_14975 [Nocardioidaceae bacterium]